MTNPDYRALCAELVEALHEHICLYEGQGFGRELVARARALLAQPVAEVGEGPSDEELDVIERQCWMSAAQAVLDAFNAEWPDGLAAALRAAADQVIPLTPKPNDTFCIPPVATMVWMRGTDIRKKLLAIAAELGAHQ